MDDHYEPEFAIITKLNGKLYNVKYNQNITEWHCIECGTPKKSKKINCGAIITDYSDILFNEVWHLHYNCDYDPDIHGIDIKNEMMSIHETYNQYACDNNVYQYTTTDDIIARIKRKG